MVVVVVVIEMVAPGWSLVVGVVLISQRDGGGMVMRGQIIRSWRKKVRGKNALAVSAGRWQCSFMMMAGRGINITI